MEIEDKNITVEAETLDGGIKAKKVFKRRYYMLFLFALCTGINACGWICFGPIYGLVEDVSKVCCLSLLNRYTTSL